MKKNDISNSTIEFEHPKPVQADNVKKKDIDWLSVRTLIGSLIVVIGLGLLLKNTIGFSFNYVWPFLIIMVGLFMIMRSKKWG